VARRAELAAGGALYFGAMLLWRVASALDDGASWGDALASLTWLVPLFAMAVGALLLLGWLTARTTAYTLTDKRVVMRIGIVLTVTYNLPLRCIESADLRAGANGQGDITLALEPGTRIAWLQLWPHVRPWRVAKTQPMLRALQGAEAVAALLQQAWADVNGAGAAQAASSGKIATGEVSAALTAALSPAITPPAALAPSMAVHQRAPNPAPLRQPTLAQS
jgi:hypothetical protein